MSREQFATHSETFTINGLQYKVTADFVAGLIFIRGTCYHNRVLMDVYTEFDGNMEEFVTHILSNESCT